MTTIEITKTVRELFALLARHPGKIQIDHVEGRNALTFTVRCAHPDMPWLVGSRGIHIQAIKTAVAGLDQDREIKVILLEAEGHPYRGELEPFQAKPDWCKHYCRRLTLLMQRLTSGEVAIKHGTGISLLMMTGEFTQVKAAAISTIGIMIGKATGRILEVEIHNAGHA